MGQEMGVGLLRKILALVAHANQIKTGIRPYSSIGLHGNQTGLDPYSQYIFFL